MKGFSVEMILLYPCLFFVFMLSSSAVFTTITTTRTIRDGDTIVSSGETFELGFFSPGSSKNRYLGIWYKNLSPLTVVWVANREVPLVDSSGALNLTDPGALVLLNRTNDIIWSSNSTKSAQTPVAQLLESGNFVVREENDETPENYLWQSFEHPSDTFLPGMKLGINRVTGQEWYLSSWKNPNDPSRGDFKLGVDPKRFSELVLSQNSVVQFRSGPWNGLGFSGTSGMQGNPIFKFEFVFNEEEMYYSYQVHNSSFISRTVLNESGLVQRYVGERGSHSWIVYLRVTTENCFHYGVCGPFGRCNADDVQTCVCLPGFVPKSAQAWDALDWSSGCVRKTPLKCENGDGFLKLSGVKLPDAIDYWYHGTMNLHECRLMCLKDCSCRAYTNVDVKRGTGCLLWFSDLMDIGDSSGNFQDFFVRIAASDLADEGDTLKLNNESTRKKRIKIIVSSVGVVGMLLLGLSLILLCGYRKKQQQQRDGKVGYFLESDDTTQKENLDLPVFNLKIIADATDNFSLQKKLGEGGFGPVYKGVLKDGQEIAVKRLSKYSNQGHDEFKNEVRHIVKLQHRNLVKLLGCCIEGVEKMLVYEYMPNKSLDSFIFDQTKGGILDLSSRFHIIDGIARGLLYLHKDSRLRIIHRDLKASNVLLDIELNPKISDFGMARSFSGNENEENTKRVVGTYGYMSPEYAIHGLYSTKSDVFSFGVLVLEIVSGKRNRGFHHPDHDLNLLGHAWKLYIENRALELVDAAMPPCNGSEALRLIHLGLLCVQRSPQDRPSMSNVVQILGGEGAIHPPKQPGFFNERDPFEAYASSSKRKTSSVHQMTETTFEAR